MTVDGTEAYEILVGGALTEAVAAAATERDLEVDQRGSLLVLRGRFRDLAELNALLLALDDLGLALVEAHHVG